MINKKYGTTSLSAGTRALTFYVVFAALLLLMVMTNQISHNDAWVLDGILVPTLMFIFIFFIVETFVKSNRKIAILTSSFLVVLNLIPGLKYQLFYNPFDSTFHFRFTNELKLFGSVPEISESYSGNPGMQILMSSLSAVSAIPVNEIFRFVMPALAGLTPLIVFFVTKGIFAENVQRYCILASAFPMLSSYSITGTSLSIGLYFLLFGVFLRRILDREKNREYLTLFIILSFALIISHAVTPLLALVLLLGIPLGMKSLHALSAKRFPRFPGSTHLLPALVHLVMLMTWWTNLATANFGAFVNYVEKILSPTGFTEIPIVPTRFFEVPFCAKMRVFLVFNIRYVILVALSLLGLVVCLRGLRQEELNKETRAFYTHLIVLIGIIAAYMLFTIGYGAALLEYQRFIVYALPFGVFFIGLALWRLNRLLGNAFSGIGFRNLVLASLLFVLVSLSLIQFFRCQPLVPTASVLGKDFSGNDYLIEVNLVNTVYQTEMIFFAEKHSSNARIASDVVTRWQVYGFSNRSFSSRHIYFSPLEPNQDRILEWDLFLLHARKAGPFGEQVEYRTTERIENLRTQAGNLIYNNGESFIISQSPNSPEPNQD